jgi:hypothetical protein
MFETSVGLGQVGTGALIALGAVAAIELAAIIWALIDIWAKRRAKSQPWLWTIVVIVLNWIGVIIYAAAGRRPGVMRPPERPQDPGHPNAQDEQARSRRAQDAVNTLYGQEKQE